MGTERGLFENNYTRALAAADDLLISENRSELLERIEAEVPELPPAACAVKFLPRLAAAAVTGSSMHTPLFGFYRRSYPLLVSCVHYVLV